jgi:hypothetical protein
LSGRALWTRLGIPPTTDADAIRRGYAARLREIDVEQDPNAFIALREARDMALSRAACCEDVVTIPDPTEPGGPALALVEAAAAPAACAENPPDPFAPIEAILFDDEEAVDEERLAALTRAALDDRAMAGVAYAAEAELRLAWAAASTMPRSDAMLGLLVAFFGWEQRAGDWDLDPHIAMLVERYRGMRFLGEIAQPNHPHHQAYVELLSRDGALGWRRWRMGGKVRSLLAEIRASFPAAEQGLEPYRIALWDEAGARSVQRGLRLGAYFFWAMFVLFRIYLAMIHGAQ